MATATKKSRAAGRLPRRAGAVRVPGWMKVVISEDNGGEYYWTLVGGDGAILARSGLLASYADAEKAARHVCSSAADARFEPRGGGASPVDLSERRSPANDNAQAERWLDEGGGFSSEPVAVSSEAAVVSSEAAAVSSEAAAVSSEAAAVSREGAAKWPR